MTDVHSEKIRSYNMSKIRSKNTKPEILVRKFLFSKGFRYGLHKSNLPGKPDMVLPKYKTVIFVQGCFWHGHDKCKYFKIPSTRQEWWINKISKTKDLDEKNKAKLKERNWKIIEVWECELKSEKVNTRLKDLLKEIKNGL